MLILGPANTKPYQSDSDQATTFLVKSLPDCPFTNLSRDLLGEIRRTNRLVEHVELRVKAQLVEVFVTRPFRVDHDPKDRHLGVTRVKLAFRRK